MKSQTAKFKLDLQAFAEDTQPADPQPADPQPTDDSGVEKYIHALEEQKKNSVPKADYDALKKENAELFKAVINGERLNTGPQDEKPDIAQLRKDLFNEKKPLNNLEYCKKALELRKAIMDEGGVDPFVPVGEKIIPEESDFKAAERVAQVMQECIDASEGDSGVFTNLLQLRTIDVMPKKKAKA